MENIVSIHNSWISCDPIKGCTLGCKYCFVQQINENHAMIEYAHKMYKLSFEQQLKLDLENNRFLQLAEMLSPFSDNSLANFPISIGNNTDMFSPSNVEHLKTFITWYDGQISYKKRPISIVTKQKIDISFIEFVAKLDLEIYLFNSLTYLDELEPNAVGTQERLEQLSYVKKFIERNQISNIKLIYSLRPFMLRKEELGVLDFNLLISTFDAFVITPVNTYGDGETYRDIEIMNRFFDSYSIYDGMTWLEYCEVVTKDVFQKFSDNGVFAFLEAACAISFIQKKAGYSGCKYYSNTSFLCDRCKVDNIGQYQRCNIFFEQKVDVSAVMKNLVNSYSFDGNIIFIHDEIDQNLYNLLRMTTGKRVVANSIKRSSLQSAGLEDSLIRRS